MNDLKLALEKAFQNIGLEELFLNVPEQLINIMDEAYLVRKITDLKSLECYFSYISSFTKLSLKMLFSDRFAYEFLLSESNIRPAARYKFPDEIFDLLHESSNLASEDKNTLKAPAPYTLLESTMYDSITVGYFEKLVLYRNIPSLDLLLHLPFSYIITHKKIIQKSNSGIDYDFLITRHKGMHYAYLPEILAHLTTFPHSTYISNMRRICRNMILPQKESECNEYMESFKQIIWNFEALFENRTCTQMFVNWLKKWKEIPYPYTKEGVYENNENRVIQIEWENKVFSSFSAEYVEKLGSFEKQYRQIYANMAQIEEKQKECKKSLCMEIQYKPTFREGDKEGEGEPAVFRNFVGSKYIDFFNHGKSKNWS